MTMLHVSAGACLLSFVLMFLSLARFFGIMYRDKYEAEDRYVTRSEVYRIVCSELKPIVEEAIAKALAAKKSGDEK